MPKEGTDLLRTLSSVMYVRTYVSLWEPKIKWDNYQLFLITVPLMPVNQQTRVCVCVCVYMYVRMYVRMYVWQSQVENEHYSIVCGLIRLVLSLECLVEITPDFLCSFMND